MLARIRQLFSRRAPALPRIDVDDAGCSVSFPDGKHVDVRWTRVVRVAAYKRDLITTDEVIVAIETDELPGQVIEISEEWPGFQDLLGALKKGLGLGAGWYIDIIQPAFAPNFRVLYERAAA